MRSVATIILVAVIAVGSANGKGWRGIVPLHSTRADVERLLGPPTEETSKYSVFYRTPNETVTIRYAEGLPCGIGEKYSQWRVPRNTVEGILVTLMTPVSLSQLGIDESKYKKKSGGHRPQDIYYIGEQEGESIRVFAGEVQDIDYFPAASDDSLACPGLRPISESGCEGLIPPRFKSYGPKQSEFEHSLLDNFVITLLDEKDRTGYIIAYAGKRARPGEAKAHAEQAKKYLVTIRSFPASRLKAINGGYREEPEVDLYVVPKGICPPSPTPTVDPRDVKIVRTRSSRFHANNLRQVLQLRQQK
jgi:hypothetical protein